MNIVLFNGDELFLIDRDRMVNDHVCACIDVRTLLIGQGRVVSAERGTVIDRVRAARVPGVRVFGGALSSSTPCHQIIGNFRPCSFAHFTAISYPASACRITPVPGSFHSARAMRLSAAALPSQTMTTPECCE